MSRFTEAGGAAFTSNRDDWETPQWLYDLIDEIWGIEVDVAANDENHKCDRYFTKEQDALKQSWGGYRCFCNPPYGRMIGSFVRKAAEESRKPGTIVIMLLPVRPDTAWWNDWVAPYADEIQFIRGRLKFELHGEPTSSAPFPSALVRFGGAFPKTNRG